MWYINVVLYQALGTALCSTGSELVLYNVTLRMCMFLMRDEKEASKVKQTNKAKQCTYMYVWTSVRPTCVYYPIYVQCVAVPHDFMY